MVPLARRIILETATLAPKAGGTLVTMHALFDSRENPEGMIGCGMKDEQAKCRDRLAALTVA